MGLSWTLKHLALVVVGCFGVGWLLSPGSFGPTTVRLCRNGEHTPFATLTVESGSTNLRRAAGNLLPGCERGSCRVFDQYGFEATDPSALTEGQLLFLVPEGRHFVWPAFHVGHTATWPGKVALPPRPITLETLSESPRVFRVTNFLSESDADALIENVRNIAEPRRKLQQSKTGAGNKVHTNTCVSVVELILTRAHSPFLIYTQDVAKGRTSESAFDVRSPVALKLKHRVFDLLGIR
jgi:hypothetical protein